jgi:uncharacterized protein
LVAGPGVPLCHPCRERIERVDRKRWRRDTGQELSRENVDIVRQVMDAEGRSDEAAIFALYDNDIEWDVSHFGGPVAGQVGTLRGHDGVRSWFRTWYEGFEDVRYELEELIDAGEHVVLVISQHARGRASGVEVSTRMFGAWTMRDAKVVRVAWFQDREEALEAVGLRASNPLAGE